MRSIITTAFLLFAFQVGFSQVYWQDQNSPLNAQYYAIDKTSANFYGSNGVASGSSEKFYHRAGTGSWNQVTTNLPAGSINGLWSLNSGSLLTCHSYITAVTFYRSTDHGATWTLVYTAPSYLGVAYTPVQSSDNTIYLVNNQNVEDIRKSTDDGVTWTTLSNSARGFKKLVTTGGTTLFGLATTSPAWVHTSTDAGATWTMSGITGYSASGGPGEIFGTPNGNLYLKNYFKSTDGGSTWSTITTAPAGPGIRFADKSNNIFVTNDPTNFFRSSDAGQTYTDVINGLGLSPTVSMQYIYTPNDGEVYVSTMEHKLYKYGLGNSVKETVAISHMEIFPNPVSSEIHLSADKSVIGAHLIICDQIGRALRSQKIDSEDLVIAVEDLTAGFYFIRIEGEEVHQSLKFIKQ